MSLGQALLKHAVYDSASGQLLAGSLMDYALPRADDLPSYQLGFNGTRCTTNPLGVKGCGEAGAVGAFPAVTNAVLDALAPLGITKSHQPRHAAADLAVYRLPSGKNEPFRSWPISANTLDEVASGSDLKV
jgi:hypothetical protein